MSKKILRQSEANVTENRDKPTQTHYCGFVFVLTCYMFARCSAQAVWLASICKIF